MLHDEQKPSDIQDDGVFSLHSGYVAAWHGDSSEGAAFAPAGERAASLVGGSAHAYALMIGGRYDLGESLGLHPYVNGGLGLSLDEAAPAARLSQNGAPALFRAGGGVVYRLGEDWDLSLNYTAAYAAPQASDTVFTGRGQEKVNLQALDMGMKLKF